MLNIYELLVLFGFGSIFGWILESVWRPLMEGRQKLKLVNPGFLLGPYLPIYGFGTIIAYFVFMSILPLWQKVLLFTALATILELITGMLLSYYKIVLWDYSHHPFNFKGYVSLVQSILWGIIGLIFYYLLLPLANKSLLLLSYDGTLLVIGLCYGIFLIDIFTTMKLVVNIKRYMSNIRWTHLPKIKINFVELKENVTEHIRNIKKANTLSKFTFSPDKLLQRDLFDQIDILVRKKKR
jgi:uncharacterized membrane protein